MGTAGIVGVNVRQYRPVRARFLRQHWQLIGNYTTLGRRGPDIAGMPALTRNQRVSISLRASGNVVAGRSGMSIDIGDAGILEFFATAAHARAAGYRERAAQLREMAESEPIGRLRERLLDLSRQFEALASSIDTPSRSRSNGRR